MSETSKKQELIPSVRITSGDRHTFFGYYDNPAFSHNDRFHLAHRVAFCDRLQEAGDVAEIGMIDMRDNHVFIPLAETTAWNFQQGSMLQWNPLAPNDEIIYNITANGDYRGAVLNVHTGALRYLERAVANVDPLGKYGLHINFGRMFDFRPGYGYADLADPYGSQSHPAEDGISTVDLNTGESKLILSLDEIWTFIQPIFQLEEAKLIINHITFNTDGTRLVFLARSVQQGNRRITALLTVNVDGSGLRCLSSNSLQSHYHWRDKSHLVMYGGDRQGNQLYLYRDQERDLQDDTRNDLPDDVHGNGSKGLANGEPEIVDTNYFKRDGHCSYSPDRNWLLYDSYPDKESYRHLYVYDLNRKKGVTLGSYYSPPLITGDIRCDLHPRWNRAGTAITFDSTHEGQRHMYYMDLQEFLR